jgi:phosphatidate cytidylyltransferase
MIALFAALIAPFGGFFASGLKRALKLKDFSDSIPGHGGVADRFDCHMVISFFTYLYLTQIVYADEGCVEKVFDYILKLNDQDKYKIFLKLKETFEQINGTNFKEIAYDSAST